jgi:hypothetical protein
MAKDLIPQPENNLVLVERFPIKSLLRSTRGKVGLLFASVPLWKLAYKTIDAWGNLQMVTDYLPRIWQFLSSTAGTFVVMFLGFALIVLQLYRQSKQPAATTKYEWLHEIAASQARDISSYVIIERVVMLDLPSATPSISFELLIRNSSNYHVAIDDRIEGFILFEGRSLHYQAKVEKKSDELPPREIGGLRIEQPLRPEEAERISQFEDNAPHYFSLNELNISIKGGVGFPQVNPQFLITKDKIPVLPEPNVKELQNLIKRLERANESLQSELDNLKTHKLTFDIDAPRSQIHIGGHPYDDFFVGFQLYIRFENSDIHPLTVRSVNILLVKRNEDKTESEIPRDELLIYSSVIENEQQVEHSWENINLSIKCRELTLYHRVEGHISVSGDYREILDKDCFLRVTMDAMNQQPSSLDFNVKWQNINLGWIGITPRR